MKKFVLLFILLTSLSLVAQKREVRIRQASSPGKTVYQPGGLGTGKSKITGPTASMAGGGTINGATVDNLSVSLSGGVNYSIPIAVPPGLNGVHPQIAITYDSHAGNGLAGWGWNVSGVSVITRIPSTLFHDNEMDGVDFDSRDRFALDGQRLIVKTGTYGGDGTVYQTEQYSNLKIVSYGSHPDTGVSGPSSFKVFYPDGSIGYYGNSGNSRSKTDYAITYWENPQGVRISYVYNKEHNALSIDKISYGSTGTSGHMNEITFNYESRSREEQSFINGTEFKRGKRVEDIRVSANQNVYRNYFLTYDTNTILDYDRLVSVRESNGTSSRSTISFDYEDTLYSLTHLPGEAVQLSVGDLDQRNAKTVPLDFNGNGKLDFIVYPTFGPDTNKKFWLFQDLQTDVPFTFADQAVDIPGGFIDIFAVSRLDNNNHLRESQGLAIIKNQGTTQVKFDIWKEAPPSTSAAAVVDYSKTWNAPTYTSDASCTASSNYRIPMKYLAGDFDGDGLSDVIAIQKPYSETTCVESTDCGGGNPLSRPRPEQKAAPQITRSSAECCCEDDNINTAVVHHIKLDRRATTNFASVVGQMLSTFLTSDNYLVSDVNGDGKSDILRFQQGKVEVYSLNATNTGLTLLFQKNHADFDLDFPVLPGDYNGDGKTDLIIPTANNSTTFAVFLSQGNDFDHDTTTFPFEYKETDMDSLLNILYGYNLIPLDINGDGKTDLIDYQTITYDNNPNNGTQSVTVYTNSKPTSGTLPFRFQQTGSTRNFTGYLKHYPIPVFLSSDKPNNTLVFGALSDNEVSTFSFTKDHREDMTLKRITNKGVVTTIKYDRVDPLYVDDSDPNFIKAYEAPAAVLTQSYPFVNVNVAPSFKVVREMVQTGAGLTRTQRYYYEGAVSHATGLGFVGFEIVKRSNWSGDNVPYLWTVSKHDPLLRGAITEQFVSTSFASNPGSNYRSKTNYFYDYLLIANPGSPIAPQYPGNIDVDYSIVGNQLDVSEGTIHLLPGFYANGNNGTYVAQILPPNEQPGDAGYAGAMDIRLERIEKDDNLTDVFSTETYTYDSFNNPLVTTTSFPGGSRVLTYTYSNNAGATNSTYHIGKPTRMVERLTLNGNSFSTEEQYTYNNNLVTQIRRKGNGTAWIVQDIQYDLSNGNITRKTLTPAGETPRVQIFDYDAGGTDKRFLREFTDFDGLSSSYTYDADTGVLKSTTDPYGLVTAYDHDSWDRIIEETDYLGNITDHTYTVLSGSGLRHNVDYADGSKEMTNYNAFGWVERSGTLSLNNKWSYVDYEYDVAGRPTRESEPHDGSPSQWNTTDLDQYGRPISQQLYTGRNITITYPGLSTIVDDGVKTVTTTRDALGNTVKVQDPGGTVDYTYYASGQLKSASYGTHVVTVGVDGWGRKTSLTDPSAGTYTYSYDGFGQLREQTSPNGTTTYDYDTEGKMTQKEISGSATDILVTYKYYESTNQIEKITGTDNENAGRTYTYDYRYDTYDRLEEIEEKTGLANYKYHIDYDLTYGRVEKETYTSELIGGPSKILTTRNVYDTSGILIEIWNDGTPEKLWELTDINARGQALSVTLGNGMEKTKVYDMYGYVTKIEDKETGTNPTTALHTEYTFDAVRGNLSNRENFGFNWQESFQYDSQDRLTSITGDVTHTMSYLNNGNIDNNDALGDYIYGDSSKKYRLTEIDPNPAGETYFQQHPTQQITYNAYKKPVEIHQAGHGRVSFEYGPLMNRSTAYYGGEDADRSLRRYKKHYSAIIPVEIVEDTQANTEKIITYVGGDAYSAPIVHIKTTGTGAIDEYHYLHRDYLGSILAITDADGDVIEERQFGAWGVVDQFSDSGGGTTFDHTALLGRGYTGHEHFFEVSLIHMNGRMYDPQLGRFLSPDNYIQEPFNTQSYNRYGYVLNNPLKYVDPSGEFGEIIVGALIAKIFFGASAILGAYGFLKELLDDNSDSNPAQSTAPTPSNNQNNSQMTSSASPPGAARHSSGNARLNDGGLVALNIPAVESSINDNNVAFTFGNNLSYTAVNPNGISQLGRRDPLQGLPKPDGASGLADQGFTITTEDVADTVLDFVPIVGGAKDIYKGIRDGDGWQVAIGAGSIILDIFTAGGASVVKGGIKTGIKAGGRYLAKRSARQATGVAAKLASKVYDSANAAFRAAKRANNIPVSSQPIDVFTVPDKINPQVQLKVFRFRNNAGELIDIRKDLPRTFPDGGFQGPHFNAGPAGGKLKQHFFFK